MSQRETLRALDASICGAFLQAGLADGAWYQPPQAPPGALPLPCVVLVDRDVRLYDEGEADAAEVVTLHTLVTLFRGLVEPVARGLVTVGTEVFRLEQLVEQDESKSRWVVLHD